MVAIREVQRTLNVILSTRTQFVLRRPFLDVGEWLSLVEHLVRDQGVGGSNPLSPTIVFGSSPETWGTECTGYMGNTFGPKGFSSGSNTRVSRSKYPRS